MLSKPITVYKDVRLHEHPFESGCLEDYAIAFIRTKIHCPSGKGVRIYEQSAYYYMQRLLRIGAIQQSGTKTIRGGTARLFKTVNPSYGLEMDWGEAPFSILANNNRQDSSNIVFFKEFITDNLFNGLMVVGAPDPHGPYKSSARDGHYAIQLAFSLGNLCNISDEFIVKLDSDARAERAINGAI